MTVFVSLPVAASVMARRGVVRLRRTPQGRSLMVHSIKVSTTSGSYMFRGAREGFGERRDRTAGADRAVRCQRVKAVDDGQYSCADRNVSSSDAVWIACAVPVLVMVANDRHDGIRKIDRRRMSAPTLACSFIFSNSAGVSVPGLFRMYSGTASFPMS